MKICVSWQSYLLAHEVTKQKSADVLRLELTTLKAGRVCSRGTGEYSGTLLVLLIQKHYNINNNESWVNLRLQSVF